MIPKSHKIFINPTVNDTGFDKLIVEDVVGFYYSELRKLLNDIECTSIKIEKLGTFKVKPKELKILKAKIQNHLNTLNDPETFNQMRIKKDLEDKLRKVNKIDKLITQENIRKQKIKQKRNEQNKGDMEK